MAFPTITSIALTRHYKKLKTQTIDAYVDVTFSNNVVHELAVPGIPISVVQAIATAASRTDINDSDIATACQNAIPDLSGTVTVYTP